MFLNKNRAWPSIWLGYQQGTTPFTTALR